MGRENILGDSCSLLVPPLFVLKLTTMKPVTGSTNVVDEPKSKLVLYIQSPRTSQKRKANNFFVFTRIYLFFQRIKAIESIARVLFAQLSRCNLNVLNFNDYGMLSVYIRDGITLTRTQSARQSNARYPFTYYLLPLSVLNTRCKMRRHAGPRLCGGPNAHKTHLYYL